MSIILKILSRFSILFLSGYLPLIFQISANLIPVIGVLFWRWNLNEILLIFVLEAVIILFFCILKSVFLLLVNKKALQMEFLNTKLIRISPLNIFLSDVFSIFKNPIVPLFISLIILIAIAYFSLFLILLFTDINFYHDEPFTYIWSVADENLIIAVIIIFLSNVVAFFDSFIYRKEYERIHPMVNPLKRISLIFIAFAGASILSAIFSDSKFAYLIVLILIKMLSELRMLLTERKIFPGDFAS